MARQIFVTEHNPQWAKQFREEAKLIKKVLSKNCVEVHHIGSTAVKGLYAKPIIDIMPVVKDLAASDALNAEFEKLGYECMGEHGIQGRRYYVKGGEVHTHHIHVFAADNKTEILRHLAVRNYLHTHPNDAAEYGELKKKLAEEFACDAEGYCNGKAEFMRELEAKSVKWQTNQHHVSGGAALGMCFGCAIGIAIGTACGNTAIGMAIGMCAGLTIGVMLSYVRKGK